MCYHHHRCPEKLRLRPNAWVPRGEGSVPDPLHPLGCLPRAPFQTGSVHVGSCLYRTLGRVQPQANDIKGGGHFIPPLRTRDAVPRTPCRSLPIRGMQLSREIHSAQDNIFYFLKTTLVSSFFYTLLNFSPLKLLLSGRSPTPWSPKEQVYFLSHRRTVIMLPSPPPCVFPYLD